MSGANAVRCQLPSTLLEVHHHLHVGKKSFVQFLLEGLMIFIAVCMGFIAEGIHEKMTNREIEKTNMEIILGNLKQDTASLIPRFF